MSVRLFGFTGERLGALDWCDPVRGETLVADSWRVENAEAVAFEWHQERFSRSVRERADITTGSLDKFFTEVRAHIPHSGSWFPRIELAHTPGGPTLRYRERPAPQWNPEVALKVAPHDPRTTPLTKGPDLEALMAVRVAVGDPATTEALIVSPEGLVQEGAYSSIMVWPEDSEEAFIVPRDTPRIPSVTEAVVVELAQERNISVVERSLTVSDLADSEVWILSAVQGIRLATTLVNGPELSHKPGRRVEWQSAWWSRRAPL
jgi:branched-subunit amino acid aminotransferase/4-amino-4-deoxychorismate lyase